MKFGMMLEHKQFGLTKENMMKPDHVFVINIKEYRLIRREYAKGSELATEFVKELNAGLMVVQ